MSRYHFWVLTTLALAALPNLLRLPLWVAGIAAVGAGIHFAGSWRWGLYGKVLSAILLSAAATGIFFSFESWFSGDAVLSFFIVVVFLKWGESHTRRDYLLLIFAAVILAAVGALYWENLLSLIHMLVVVFALVVSLVAIHMDETGGNQAFIIRLAGQMLLLGLPLMLLLFLTFPRIPGPIWDIGLAFGLPVKVMMDRGTGQFGKIMNLQPGAGGQRPGEENENVLVAEFEGVVPFVSRLYWRGPVFWDFDGESWSLPEDWDDRGRLLKGAIRSKKKLDYELRWRNDPVKYTLRVMPNGGRWLYGLDVPAAPAPEAFISEEFQLLSIRRIADHEPKFKMLSFLEYRTGTRLTEEQQHRGLAFPENTNPRLQALGQQMAEQHEKPADIVQEGLRYLATNDDFQFEPGHVVSPGYDMLDRYFFDEKKGGAEYLAGSFVMLMRAAGIPARLVSGFRGGTIIALTNFVIVKRSNAHVWVEVWEAGQGWKRVEPKDIILQPEDKPKPKVEKPAAGPQVEIKQEKGELPPVVEDPVKKKKTKVHAPAPPKPESAWHLPDWSSLFGNMQKWVVDYDPDRQMDLLKGVGMEGSDWLDLMISGALGVLALLLIYLAFAWWRNRRRLDHIGKSWFIFLRRLEKKFNLKKTDHECPRNYRERVAREKPELAAATEDIIERYIDIRYGENSAPEAAALFRRQVQRFTSMT